MILCSRRMNRKGGEAQGDIGEADEEHDVLVEHDGNDFGHAEEERNLQCQAGTILDRVQPIGPEDVQQQEEADNNSLYFRLIHEIHQDMLNLYRILSPAHDNGAAFQRSNENNVASRARRGRAIPAVHVARVQVGQQQTNEPRAGGWFHRGQPTQPATTRETSHLESTPRIGISQNQVHWLHAPLPNQILPRAQGQPREEYSQPRALLANATIPRFNGSDIEDAESWIDDLGLLALQHNLSNDEICHLFPLCLRGEETKRRYQELSVTTRANWGELQRAWLEIYPSLNAIESPMDVLHDFMNMRLDEKSLMSESTDKDGRRVWELVLFSCRLASIGSRISGITPLTKGQIALSNLPLIVRNHLPRYDTSREPTLAQLCRDMTSADHHGIAAAITEKVKFSEEMTNLRREVQQLRAQHLGLLVGANLQRNNFHASAIGQNRPRTHAPNSNMLNSSGPLHNNRFEAVTFPDTPEGLRLYFSAVQQWNRTHGEASEPTIDSPYPLSPGSPTPGSGECLRCGSTRHKSFQTDACRPEEALPRKEQVYRRVILEAVHLLRA